MDRRQFLALGGASTVVGLAGCSDVFDGGDTQPDDGAQTDTDDAAGWRSVGRTPRNHVYHPTAVTPQSSSSNGTLPRRWGWQPSLPDADGDPTFTGQISGVVSDGQYLYTVVSGTMFRSNNETSPLNTLFAIDPASGETVWRTAFNDGPALGSAVTPAVADERILLVGRTLQAFRRTGERDWRTTPAQVATGPPVATDADVYLPTAGGVECRTLADGSERWTVSPGAVSRSSTVAVAENTVYASLGNEVVALARADGTERWRTDAGTESALRPGSRTPVGTPVVDDQRVYVAGGFSAALNGDNAALVALDRASGDELWRYRPEPSAAGDGPQVAGVYGLPVLVDGRLLAIARTTGGDPTGYSEFGMVAINTADGSEIWASALSQTLATSVVGASDTVYAGTGGASDEPTENALAAFDTADGSPVGVGETDGMGGISRGQPVAVVDDAIVVPTRNGLVAFGESAE
ncbi:outer membrane protein assembly factor BamB family protein [Halovenus halobia]|uniref:PQQ-like beta-propeller repeat protein n=1 Tax=Halovenus halobia TaxID=3396622 RepID=UPI003F568A26